MTRRHKYGAIATEVDGIRFDSKKEAARYTELKLLQKAGEIRDLTLQPSFKLMVGTRPIVYDSGRQAVYRGDFMYWDHQKNRMIVEDVKGMDTAVSKLKRAMVKCQVGIEINLI